MPAGHGLDAALAEAAEPRPSTAASAIEQAWTVVAGRLDQVARAAQSPPRFLGMGGS